MSADMFMQPCFLEAWQFLHEIVIDHQVRYASRVVSTSVSMGTGAIEVSPVTEDFFANEHDLYLTVLQNCMIICRGDQSKMRFVPKVRNNEGKKE